MNKILKTLINLSFLALLPSSLIAQDFIEKYINKDSLNLVILNYTKAIEADSNDMTAYFNRGKSLYEKLDFNKALADLKRVIEANPKNHEAYFYRGRTYQGLQNDGAAMRDYNKAIELKKDYGKAYLSRGILKNLLESNIPQRSGNKDLRKAQKYGAIKDWKRMKPKKIKKNIQPTRSYTQ